MSLITFPFRLDALGKTPKDREQVRRYFWELMTQQHTPLINRLNLLVAEHPKFANWQIKNTVDADDLLCLWRSLKKQPQFQGIPDRACVSARLVTHNTYESWLALQADRQEKLTKLLNSVEILKPDVELIAIGSCNLDVIRNRAKEVLSEVNTQISNDSEKKKSQKAIEGGIYKILYDKHRKTDDLVEKCAIAYLIKNRFKINSDETEEDVKKLNARRHTKQKEIEIIQKQLHSRLPKGRPWAGRDIFGEIASIDVRETEWNSIESALLKQQTFMPHPILFESSDDLIWAEPEKFQLKDLQVEAGKSGSTELDEFQNENFQGEQANSVESRKRVCVGFKSFEEKYAFEVAGDYRHIHAVWQALKERKIYDKNIDENTSALFLVRSATLIWRDYKKNENRIVRRRKANNKRSKREGGTAGTKPDSLRAPAFYDPEFPWNRYQLFLHCTIETLYVSKEGTELKLEMQKKPITKALQTLEKNITESEEKGESTKNRKDRHSRQSGTLRRMECYDDNYERPSKSLYTGQPHIVTGIALGASGLVTATIVDTSSGKILECRGRKALLGKQDRLVNRRQFQRQLNMRRRTQNQRRGANNQFGEANLGDTIDRHIANAVVDFAKTYQSGCIVLPDMEDYRRRKQSEMAALAERECSGWKGVEKKFAKAQNVKIHSWSYGRSIEYITNQAEKEGMLVKIGRQPIHGSSQEQAKQMAIEVYQDKTKFKQSLSNQSA
ncbi:type V CRISPR-associated protein Cas12k [Chamaesiphon minutus]|uniref:Uncharacterized protein n=1 Tax=Chamaesiphon minutus (strain ATCC 27169 / PCC 6605) TaxID=1173020 RepID=K9ULQ5_CHAP6|nr:type V CRISPR-associated protein Cas12k [Chamaesiphon minutus]AFY95134.1 hypothetical protein Cha6605_4190 [Chamaesiphon minutus PCC 6605]